LETSQPTKKPNLFLAGEVNEDMLLRVIPFLHFNKGKPVQVFISSQGGDTRIAIEIYNFFQQHKKVTCIATGYCMSAATICILGAYKKLATPSTEFLIHYGHNRANSLLEERLIIKSNEETYRIYESALNLKEGELEMFMNSDIYLGYERALELKLIDGEYRL